MDNFMRWYITHYNQITWFIIGFLASTGLEELAEGNNIVALINLALAFVNYMCYSERQ